MTELNYATYGFGLRQRWQNDLRKFHTVLYKDIIRKHNIDALIKLLIWVRNGGV